ncbi:ABC transporter ATP-binding protein [Clostridium butyricum]|uniref:Bacitracin transport ATP-binding protein BcrA n=1 Tax=Clostridium butyricum E4 str. BoNT E BL5262 TaxID=632245 RepID=C4ILS6_CLOBU|nr:ABC transporter ATP-binding protein [Clostridium butyricum]APF22988.1 ABC transporter family protein [Clostridium butyricum]EDT74569.1 bacitracin transport ATP-binding protein BcrA [Clostridium butyricum 5521]EEP52661.1 bacitracin transport ATP-binding protein BcrA [Clostridium butyricum E4 str. BoNT E BL5262]MCQ2012077.1 ABC transporter ATP-binding protein [Clostridium butyricum]MCQ2024483.1 ABC transporter ATP-binding protein [Clostridium butyricum]
MNAVLELKNVSKIMNGKALVEDINFTVNKGEIFGFLGPNGAGKTTTIKMITGLYSISKGEIYIDGNSVKKNFEKALQGVGGIIENPEMYGYLSGYDNLKLYARMHGLISKERIDEVVNLVKLGNRINDKVSRYSLGMRQRLGVAQALLHKPKLLILDEPTNGLDPMGIKELRQTLRELAEKEGLSVMVSSHLLSEMELMCDRFGIIDGGKMIGIRTMEDIKKNTSANIKTYILDVDNKEKALEIIKSNNKNVSIIDSDDGIKVSCEKDQLARVNKLLIENAISLFTVQILTKSLEDEFMEVTKGSKDQIR